MLARGLYPAERHTKKKAVKKKRKCAALVRFDAAAQQLHQLVRLGVASDCHGRLARARLQRRVSACREQRLGQRLVLVDDGHLDGAEEVSRPQERQVRVSVPVLLHARRAGPTSKGRLPSWSGRLGSAPRDRRKRATDVEPDTAALPLGGEAEWPWVRSAR